MASTEVEVTKTCYTEIQLLIRQNKNEFLKLMSGFSLLDRDILVMRFFLEMTNEEIAANIGLAKATVENRIYASERKIVDTFMPEKSTQTRHTANGK